MTDEMWRPVVNFEGAYEVSNLGRVRSVSRSILKRPSAKQKAAVAQRIEGRILRIIPTKTGYAQVTLSQNGFVRPRKVHHLVLAAFVGPRPQGMMGLHEDDDGMNAQLSNLRYGTGRDNVADCKANGNFVIGEQRSQAKLTERAAGAVKALLGEASESSLAKALGVSRGAIKQVRLSLTWAHVPPLDLAAARAEIEYRKSIGT